MGIPAAPLLKLRRRVFEAGLDLRSVQLLTGLGLEPDSDRITRTGNLYGGQLALLVGRTRASPGLAFPKRLEELLLVYADVGQLNEYSRLVRADSISGHRPVI